MPLEQEERAIIIKAELEKELRDADPDYEANEKEREELDAKIKEMLGDSEEDEWFFNN